jgi:1-acyl-sn-glycerol-3-phosphate acyltransferase
MWLYHINHALGPAIGLYWRLRLTGARESIPGTGPLLIASNHASYLDPWLVGMVFPRPIRWLITPEWYHRSPRWRAVFRAFGTVPQREGDPRATIRAVRGHLGAGEVVGVFPEGRISGDGRIARLHRGVTTMAAQSGAPVLPVGIRGNHRSLPRHGRFPRPTPVRVVVGEPLRFPGAPHRRPARRAESRVFHESLVREICRLADQAERIPELVPGASSEPG